MGASRVLIVGGGGREHALAWKLAAERGVGELICAPGNAGIARIARCLPVDAADPRALAALARHEAVDLTVVGPEVPLSHGVADAFAADGLRLFGPTERAARLESSKVFAKEFMRRYAIPTAAYRVCESAEEALGVARAGQLGWPLVVKADGLAAGKGVVIAADAVEAESNIRGMMIERQFGAAGARLVLEECLTGREASFFAVSDGTRAVRVGSAEDHKRALDGDAGPNTGGMGAYAPSTLVDAETDRRVMAEIVEPVIGGMRADGHEFRGFLFIGLMLTSAGPKVIEFNVRFGDPEAQVLLPMITDDLAPLLDAAAAGEMANARLALGSDPHVGVVLASGGYPGTYETGKRITGVEAAEQVPGAIVFHSGTAVRGADLVTAAGRVLTVVGRGADYRGAIDRAYEAVERIAFDGMHYRKDIAAKAIH